MPRPRSRGIASSSATGSIKGISVEPGWRPIRHLSAEEEEEENRVGAVTPPSLSRVFSLVRSRMYACTCTDHYTRHRRHRRHRHATRCRVKKQREEKKGEEEGRFLPPRRERNNNNN